MRFTARSDPRTFFKTSRKGWAFRNMNAPSATADIGLIGLAVMGENLVLNMESHGFTVAVFNRTTAKVDDFVDGRGQGQEDRRLPLRRRSWSRALKRPRKVMMMVKAGPAVDELIDELAAAARAGRHPHRRRQHALPRHQPPHQGARGARACCYVGTGVSGGEEGRAQGPVHHARRRSPTAWPHVKPIFQAIAAKVDRRRRPAATGSAPTAPATTSRWSTTASSTATCSSSAKPTTLLKDALGLSADETARGLRRVEQGRARQLPDRDHRATSSAYKDPRPASRWSTRSSTPPARRAPASGRVSSALDLGVPADADRRGRLRPLPLGA